MDTIKETVQSLAGLDDGTIPHTIILGACYDHSVQMSEMPTTRTTGIVTTGTHSVTQTSMRISPIWGMLPSSTNGGNLESRLVDANGDDVTFPYTISALGMVSIPNDVVIPDGDYFYQGIGIDVHAAALDLFNIYTRVQSYGLYDFKSSNQSFLLSQRKQTILEWGRQLQGKILPYPTSGLITGSDEYDALMQTPISRTRTGEFIRSDEEL